MIVRTHCARMDHGGCGMLVHVESGRITKIEGDPDSPLSGGTVCAKGLSQLDKLNHPDRLKTPLKRAGQRGEGKWERLSWEEALDAVAGKIRELIDRDGPNAISFAQGAPKGLEFYLMLRLANLLNVPNVASPGHICHMPRETASMLSCGFMPVADFERPPACIVVWGSNLFQTNEEGVIGYQLKQALDRGASLLVIDPRRTGLTSRANLWLQPRPGTDLALAMGIMRVIVEEGLYDEGFVEGWCEGFPELKTHLQKYALEEVAETTWVPKEKIIQAARLFSQTKPACIQWGNALEHNLNSFQCARALLILMAITGNLDVPGGNVNRSSPPLMRMADLIQIKTFPDKREKMMSPQFRLATMMGFVPSQVMVKAILTGLPHLIRFMYIQGGNPLLSYANASETFEALRKIEFLAISEIFMTPTAQMADLVLPAATHFEFDDIGHLGLPQGFVLARPKIVEPPGECWPDSKILNELGRKLGYSQYFWKDIGECLDEILSPAEMTYDDLKKAVMLKGTWRYRSYEKKGFHTPSRKFEIFSNRLREWGYDPLPDFRELPESPLSTPDLSKDYPLIFTSAKDPFYFHSSGRNIPSLRKLSPEPVVLIHPETASRFDIAEGTWVSIETKRGTIRQKAKFAEEIDPGVVILSFGWWFPEREDPLSGWKESNLNILTDSNPPYDPGIGSTPLRGVLCRISKARNSV